MNKLDQLIDKALVDYTYINSHSEDREYQQGYIEGLIVAKYLYLNDPINSSRDITRFLKNVEINTWHDKALFNAMVTAGKIIIDMKKDM